MPKTTSESFEAIYTKTRLSTLDQWALGAMQGYLASKFVFAKDEYLARRSYDVAQAMLDESIKRQFSA